MAITEQVRTAIPDTGIPTIDGIELTPKEVAKLAPPTFDNVEDERLHRKQQLAAALRIFGRLGFGEGVAGHITARDPEFTDHFWVNPFGKSFRLMKVSDLICVNHHGDVVYGNQPVNRAAFVLHSAIHKARPDVIAAAHAHSVYGKAWSTLGRKLDPITQDSCAFYEDHVLIKEQGGAVVLEVAAGEEIASHFPTGKAAIHQNHGLFTVGKTVEAAAFWFITMERNCQAQLLAEAVGKPILVPHEMAQYTQQLTGFPDAGWLQFQPLFQEICKTDPELFE